MPTTTTPDVLAAKLSNGAILPLRKAENKQGKPYWVFDANGREHASRAARFGVAVAGTDTVDIPDALTIAGDGITPLTIPLVRETVRTYHNKATGKTEVTEYDDRRTGKGTVAIPGEGARPVEATISRKHAGGNWQVKIAVCNTGTAAPKASLADFFA